MTGAPPETVDVSNMMLSVSSFVSNHIACMQCIIYSVVIIITPLERRVQRHFDHFRGKTIGGSLLGWVDLDDREAAESMKLRNSENLDYRF